MAFIPRLRAGEGARPAQQGVRAGRTVER